MEQEGWQLHSSLGVSYTFPKYIAVGVECCLSVSGLTRASILIDDDSTLSLYIRLTWSRKLPNFNCRV